MFILTMADGRKGEGLSVGVVCRDKYGEWVKRNWRRRVVCRGKYGEWVKRPVGGVWSVGAKRASGSRELLAECGLSGQVWRVGQEACRWVWSVGAKMLRGSKGLSLECGLSARKRRVNQRNHTYRMPQTSQIATQIKIAKILKT